MESPQPRVTRGAYSKSAERRQQIVDAAYRAFATRGFRGASLREIAADAGISLGSLQHHFRSKEELLLEVLALRDRRKGLSHDPGPDSAGGAEDRAGELVDEILAQAARNESIPGLIALYSSLAAESFVTDHPGRPYFVDRYSALRDRFTASFTELSEVGRLRPDVDPAVAAGNLVALWEGLQLQWLYFPDLIDVAAALRAQLSLVLIEGPGDVPALAARTGGAER